jgi:serine palmitoyltransferase
VDEGVHFAIQKGLTASRSRIKFFKHNDVDDLHRLLKEQAIEDKKNPKKAKVTRRFLVVEGLYMNHGDICPLPEMIKLKNEYKVRIFVDETVSFAVLGKSGRGITEHFNIPVDEIDHFSASLENAMAAYGGFCCGTTFIVDHQRLSGLGYCFSASLPPLQAAVALTALDELEKYPDMTSLLRQNCEYFQNKLEAIANLEVECVALSPDNHVRFAGYCDDRDRETKRLEKVVQFAWERQLALTVARYLDKEEAFLPKPSIRLIVNTMLSEQDMDGAIKIIKDAFENFASS